MTLWGMRAQMRQFSAVGPSARKRTAAPPVVSTAVHPSDSNSCAKSLDNPGTHVAIKSDSGASLSCHCCAASRHAGGLGRRRIGSDSCRQLVQLPLFVVVVDHKFVKASA
eukprot:scaffold294_cov221-Amphora_coffeaeformis.AAC.39